MGIARRPCDHCRDIYQYKRLREPGYCGPRCRKRAERERASVPRAKAAAIDAITSFQERLESR